MNDDKKSRAISSSADASNGAKLQSYSRSSTMQSTKLHLHGQNAISTGEVAILDDRVQLTFPQARHHETSSVDALFGKSIFDALFGSLCVTMLTKTATRHPVPKQQRRSLVFLPAAARRKSGAHVANDRFRHTPTRFTVHWPRSMPKNFNALNQALEDAIAYVAPIQDKTTL